MTSQGTIFALSSGRGRAGVAVIRISGPGAHEALARLGAGGLGPRRASLRRLVDPDDGTPLDQALCLWFPGPGSFTGEDMAELHVHGGRAVTEAVLEALSRLEGLAPAEPGAFTRRAFHNGRLDLTAVEGLADLVAAETEAQRRQALAQAGGALAALYEGWRAELVRAMARLEAAIDFSDEGDVPEDPFGPMRERLSGVSDEIAGHLAGAVRAERLREGFTVVVAGPPNAGKSSLVNLLARRDVAIVADSAGTTRDPIEVHLDLGGYPVILIDTAGLREAEGEIESEGVRRAEARIAAADLVLWLEDATVTAGGATAPAEGTCARLVLFNKADLVDGRARKRLVGGAGEDARAISAKTGLGIDGLLDDLLTRARVGMETAAGPVPTRIRHRHGLETARGHILRALEEDRERPELVAENLRLAARALGGLTGRVDVEDLLDAIFREFCIGK